MVSRKSHPKSRNGCAQCKRRRIKCDEVWPECTNCIKHSIECDFAQDPSKASESSPTSQTHRTSDAKLMPNSSAVGSPAVRHGSFDGPGMILPALQMDDLELLHHFTTETSFTLSDRRESHELWRVTVPQEAFNYDFLMRGILAIAALHLSVLRPDKQDHYTQIAVKQQDIALSSFRSIMSEIDQSNCDAFFALSSLIVVYGFESPKASNSLGLFDYKGSHSDEWLPLIRGVNSVIQSVWEWIKIGRLRGLLHDHQQETPQTSLPPVLDTQLTHLDNLCNSASGGEESITAYRTAVGQLRWCFVRMNNRPPYECEVSIAFLWPVMIPAEFVSRLNAKDSLALIILAHYCVILHHLDDYWWMNGWAMHTITTIHGELGEEWRAWIDWPMSVVTVQEKVLTNGTLQNPIQQSRVSNDFNTSIDRSLAIPGEVLEDHYPGKMEE